MRILITIIIVGLLLILNEYWWRKNKNGGETGRKVIHSAIGTYAAFWPFYLSWNDIRLISLALLLGVLLSKQFKLFKSIHDVDRTTLGEVFFAIVIGLLTFITKNKYIYMAALLQMGLADGAAAIFGTRYGIKTKYKILSQQKSLIGSLAFLVVSIGVLLVYGLIAPGNNWSINLVLIALSATILENISIYGLDNLTVPIVTAILLRF